MCLFYVLLCITFGPFEFCNHLDGEERAGCLTVFDFLMSCDCCCSVALPRWSAVCDPGIS